MEENCEGEGALIANRRDGGECRASQHRATGTRGSRQSHGPCARNGLQAPGWGPQKCRAGRRREEETRRKLKTHHTMAWRRAATVEVAIGTAVRAQDGHRSAACRSAQSGTARGRVREEQSRGPPHRAWAREQRSTRKAWRQVQERSAGTPGACRPPAPRPSRRSRMAKTSSN